MTQKMLWSPSVKKSLVCLLITLLLLFVGYSVVVSAQSKQTDTDLFEEYYKFNQTIVIPDYYFGATKANVSIETPNGKAYSVKNIKLNESGYYTVLYSAMVDGEFKTYYEKFFVQTPKYYVDGDEGSYSYQETIFSNGEKDLIVSLKDGEQFHYNKIINLSDATVRDDIVSLYAVPGSIGANDVSHLFVKFTDIYDQSIHFTVCVSHYSYDDGSYAKVSFGDQPYVGTENWNGKIFTDTFGMYNITNLSGVVRVSSGDMYDGLIKIRYDSTSKEVFMPNYIFAEGTNDDFNLVSDLDNGAFYNEAFAGFTTGEVRMSIWCEGYASSTAKLAFVDVNGDDLSVDLLSDGATPKLTIDNNGVVPDAIVGRSYKLFNATAYDKEDGAIPVVSKVYFNYKGTNESDVSIVNGEFVPNRVGTYTIVYSATDKMGMSVVETVSIKCVKAEDVLSLELKNKIVNGLSGENISIAEYSINKTMECGDISVDTSVFDDQGNSYEVVDGQFKAVFAGDYVVKYFAKARNGAIAENEYSIQVTHNNAPIFLNDIVLPDYYLHGGEYVVPSLKAYDISSGTLKELDVSIYYKNLAGEEVAATGSIVKPEGVYGSESVVEIIYRAQLGANIAEKIYEVKVINANSNGGYDYSKMFIGENVSLASSSSGVRINSENGGGKVTYIKELNQNLLSWAINVNPNKNNFSKLNFYLTDSIDSSQRIKISVLKGPVGTGNSYAVLNDGLKKYTIAGSFDTPEGLTKPPVITLEYNPQTKVITDLLNPSIVVNKTVYGDVFEGFKSGAVILSMEFEGVSSSAEIYWHSIGNQYFTKQFGADNVSPTGTFLTDCGGDCGFNDDFIVSAVKAYDIISAKTKVYVTVTKPDGDYATSTDGVLLNMVDATKEYFVKSLQYGEYVVNYVIIDDSGNENYSLGYSINVIDATAPTINISGEMPSKATVGSKIVLPEAEIKDDIDSNVNFVIVVRSPSGIQKVLAENSFTPTMQGEYVIYYVAVDSYGNTIMNSYIMNVGD